MKLFVDTWGWVELNNKRAQRHDAMTRFYQSFLRRRVGVYTTDYVLDETITLLFQRLPYSMADESLTLLEQAIAAGVIQLELIHPPRFAKAVILRRKYRDKPRISFTDFTSMVVMQELGIVDVMTEDDHFTQVGLGFHKIY